MLVCKEQVAAQAVETSVTVTNSSFQNYTHPDNHARQTIVLIINPQGSNVKIFANVCFFLLI